MMNQMTLRKENDVCLEMALTEMEEGERAAGVEGLCVCGEDALLGGLGLADGFFERQDRLGEEKVQLWARLRELGVKGWIEWGVIEKLYREHP